MFELRQLRLQHGLIVKLIDNEEKLLHTEVERTIFQCSNVESLHAPLHKTNLISNRDIFIYLYITYQQILPTW